MVLRLAERLDVPLRDRNVLLMAAGYAPAYPQRDLGDPALSAARRAMDVVLKAHLPNPALAVDRQLEPDRRQSDAGASAARRADGSAGAAG